MADRYLRPTLVVLVGLTALSCLQVVFAPLGPSAALGPPPGPIAGYTATPLPPRPGRAGRDWVISPTERQRLQPADGKGATVELSRTALSTRRSKDLQLAAITASDPALALRRRRLLPVADGEIGIGTIGDQTALQGCRSWNDRSVVSNKAYLTVPSPLASDPAEKLRRLLGLAPNSSYTCELLTLTTAPDAGDEERLKVVWDRL